MPDTKEHYKINRELLDDILSDYDVPKMFWHNMIWLNSNLEYYILPHAETFEKAINLVHKLSPIPLTRLYSIKYDE